MTTFKIGPAPLQDLPSPQALQTGTTLALQPALQPIRPAANAQPALQPVTQALQQAPVQPALQPITQVLQQATPEPILRPVTPVLQQTIPEPTFRPITPVLQQTTPEPILRAVTPVLQPVISEKALEEATVAEFDQQARQLFNQDIQAFEAADMALMQPQQQLYQITGQDGQPMIVNAAQLQQMQQPQQYILQQQPAVQQVVQQADSRPTSVYYTQGAMPGQQVMMSNGQIVTPAVAPVTTTTAHGGPVVVTQAAKKEDDLLSFYDPAWYKTQSSAGGLTGSTLAWIVFTLILIALILHVIAFGMPYWSFFTLSGFEVSFGLWQGCDHVLGCYTPDMRLTGTVVGHLRASQALGSIALVGVVILVVIFLIFLANTQHKKSLEILTIVVSFITAIIMLSLLSVWEANVRQTLSTATHGASFILEVLAFIFTLLIALVATIDYMLVTRKAP